jgi:uncharacterized protein (TIGR03437 family)
MLLGFSTGPPPGRTGSPVDGGTACIACHRTGVINDGSGVVSITTSAYTPGVKQKITVNLQHPTAQRWGFEISARLASDETKKAGTFTIPDDLRMVCGLAGTEAPCGDAVEFVTHTQPQTGAGTSGGRTWEFEWTPPDTNVGAVVFYAAGNAANNNNTNAGDSIYTTSLIVGPASATGPKPVITAGGVQAIYAFNTNFASHSWLAISGRNLATRTVSWDNAINGGALPIMLGSATVKINGRAAPIQFVSPTQITVIAPLDENLGDADVVVANENGTSDAVKVRRVDAAPAIKSAPGTDGRRYIVGAAADGTIIGKSGTDPAVQRAARPGETISLLASGCGTTDPLSAADRFLTATPLLVSMPVLMLNNQPMTLKSAQLIAPGFYQLDVTVPDGMTNGDYAVVANSAGNLSSNIAYLTIAR